MKALLVSDDPDLCAALKHIRATDGETRDMGLVAIAAVLFPFSMTLARQVVREISPKKQALGWVFASSSRTVTEADIEVALASVNGYVPDMSGNARGVTKTELRNFFYVLAACIRRDWSAARSVASLLRSLGFYLDALEMIAARSGLHEDRVFCDTTSTHIVQASKLTGPNSFSTWCILSPEARPVTSKYLASVYLSRENQLRRLMNCPVLPDIVGIQIRMVAESGNIQVAEDAMNRLRMTPNEHDLARGFACGHALNGDYEMARRYAALVPDAVSRSFAYLQIFSLRRERLN